MDVRWPGIKGSRSSQAGGVGQLAGHAQEAIQALKVKTKMLYSVT